MATTPIIRRERCPARGCTARRKANHVMCPRHWFQVPDELRSRIWALYRDAPGSPDHLAAVREAIAMVGEPAQAVSPPAA